MSCTRRAYREASISGRRRSQQDDCERRPALGTNAGFPDCSAGWITQYERFRAAGVGCGTAVSARFARCRDCGVASAVVYRIPIVSCPISRLVLAIGVLPSLIQNAARGQQVEYRPALLCECAKLFGVQRLVAVRERLIRVGMYLDQ